MVTNSINLTIHETYDLNTKVDKITLLAIRTPSFDTVSRYVSPKCWSKIKFNRASFRLACASQLPVDPLGVGYEAGQISPQELINPILFKTVTGDSLGPILDVIYGPNATHDNGDSIKDLEVSKVVTFHTDGHDDLATDPMAMYYTLLGDTSFRQSHPQVGISAGNIIPLVREVYTTMPLASSPELEVGIEGSYVTNNKYYVGDFVPGEGKVMANPGTYGNVNASGRMISGRTVPMPAIDTMPGSKFNTGEPVSWPMSYCAICIMPPSVQRSLYYRCIVSWNITLSGFVPSYQQDAYFGTKSDHMYNDWTDRPVSEAVAVASELWDDNGLIVTDGMENVNKVTQTVT